MSFKYKIEINSHQHEGQSPEWVNLLCIMLVCGGMTYGGLWVGSKLVERVWGDRPVVGIELPLTPD